MTKSYSLKAGDVETVVVGGRLVMHDRRVFALDESEVLRRAREYGEPVRRSLEHLPR